jgi:hypothetical protein
MTRHRPLYVVCTIVTVLFFVNSCSRSKPVAAVEAPPALYQPSPQESNIRVNPVVPPTPPEVRDAVNRVFKGAAVIDTSHEPSFFAGDFNGDASQDLAVVIKAAPPDGLSRLNEDYPAWLIRDPLAVKAQRTQLKIAENEVLLAIIHGFGPNDWRDPQATQTFVLKNVVGNGMAVSSGQQFVAANSGRKLPRPQGDLIAEAVGGTSGYLYYASSTYSWYDPKTYRPEVERGVVHMPRR